MAKRKAAEAAPARKSATAGKKTTSTSRAGSNGKSAAAKSVVRTVKAIRRRRAAAPTLIPPLVPVGALQAELDTSPSSIAVRQENEPEPVPGGYIDRGQPIPENYGYDRLVALVRDPRWIFAYWELHGGRMPEIVGSRGQQFVDECAWVLRLYRLNEGMAVDMEIDPSIGNWYICVGAPGKYQLELALLSPDGEWITLLVSQIIETPLAGPSDVIDEEWRLRPEDEEALAALLGKLGLADAENRGNSGFLGASRLQSSFAMASSMTLLGSSGSGRPVVGSWGWSFLGASRVAGSGSGSGGFGWLVSPTGAHEPVLERPSLNAGPNWNAQPDLPATPVGKTQQPNFKVKLPRTVRGLKPPAPTWPPVQKPVSRLAKGKATARA